MLYAGWDFHVSVVDLSFLQGTEQSLLAFTCSGIGCNSVDTVVCGLVGPIALLIIFIHPPRSDY